MKKNRCVGGNTLTYILYVSRNVNHLKNIQKLLRKCYNMPMLLWPVLVWRVCHDILRKRNVVLQFKDLDSKTSIFRKRVGERDLYCTQKKFLSTIHAYKLDTTTTLNVVKVKFSYRTLRILIVLENLKLTLFSNTHWMKVQRLRFLRYVPRMCTNQYDI